MNANPPDKAAQSSHVQYKKKLWQILTPYFYILPACLLFGLFTFFPFGKTLFLSLHTTDPLGEISYFNGVKNYTDTLVSQQFLNSLSVTVRFALLVVIASILCGLITAILANEKVPGRGVFRTFYALPIAVSAASAAVIFLMILHPTAGILNYLLKSNTNWMNDVKWALISVSAVTVWMNIGLNFIFILAALQSVDLSLYEAAAIEGIGFFRKHWNITLPSISPTLFFLLIINVINSFQAYAQVNLMTRGGPGQATNVIVYQIYQEAFFNNRFGVACAQSVILFVIILVLTMIQFRVEKKVTY